MANFHTLLSTKQQYVATLVLFLTMKLHPSLGMGKIGVDYGLNADDLMTPEQTVALLKARGISTVRMYDARQEVTRAFVNSGIDLMIGVPNELVPKIGEGFVEAFNWVTQNVASFPAAAGISAVIVGNEWLLDPANDPLILLPAMVNIYTALTRVVSVVNLDLSGIKVSTAHAFNVLGVSFPPSSAAFEAGLLSVLSPLLDFLQQTGSFFMVNVFPYFAYVNDPNVSLEFALFEARQPVQDPNTKLNYTNLFDLQLDAVYAALDHAFLIGINRMKEASTAVAAARRSRTENSGQKRPRVVVGESGWPSGPGDSGTVPHVTAATDSMCSGRVCTAATVENARTYNQNLIRHVLQSKGTPANPTMPIQAYIFALFNENLKPAGTEQHYGLFFPNGTSVYPITFH